MADFKLTINDPKTGKSYKKEITGQEGDSLLGKVIGDKADGGQLGLPGYEFEIMGGSDKCGFPLRKDVDTERKKILAVAGVGVAAKERGQRQRKTVCGRRITNSVTQVNLAVLKAGKAPLEPAQAQEPKDSAAGGK